MVSKESIRSVIAFAGNQPYQIVGIVHKQPHTIEPWSVQRTWYIPGDMSDYFDEGIPLGYHITFRAYGTWLHGDSRGSVDRLHNRFGTPRLPRNEQWEQYNRNRLKLPPVKLKPRQREVIESAIREICIARKWTLWVTNARTNHIHSVISAFSKPEQIRTAIKAAATKKLREAGLWRLESTPWAKEGSIKWLWTERSLMNAIVYVESGQGP